MAFRITTTVIGKATLPDGSTQITFQGTAPLFVNENQLLILNFAPNSIDPASFSIGQTVWFDMALTQAEQTSIAGAVTVTPVDTEN